MALVIDLKPSEKIVIGGAVVTNGDSRTRLHIEGDAPILREKDIMHEKEADTPCKKAYMALQLMYLSPTPKNIYPLYFEIVRDIQKAAPSTALFFLKIHDHLLNDEYYKALKEAHNLIEHEREILANV